MGCSYNFVCKDCKKSYYLGYGSYSSWINVDSVVDYNKQPDTHKNLRKNINIETCLKEHSGHDYFLINGDIMYVKDNNLYYDLWVDMTLATENYNEYEVIDLYAD